MIKVKDVQNYIVHTCLQKAMGTPVQSFKGTDGVIIRSLVLGSSKEQFDGREDHKGEIFVPDNIMYGEIVRIDAIDFRIPIGGDKNSFPESLTIDISASDSGEINDDAEIFKCRFMLGLDEIKSLYQQGVALADIIVVSQEDMEEMKDYNVESHDYRAYGLVPVKVAVDLWQ